MLGTVKAFDPTTGLGSLLCQSDLNEVDLAPTAFARSTFRFLRQGQTLTFELDENNQAINLRFGSESDMKTPSNIPH